MDWIVFEKCCDDVSIESKWNHQVKCDGSQQTKGCMVKRFQKNEKASRWLPPDNERFPWKYVVAWIEIHWFWALYHIWTVNFYDFPKAMAQRLWIFFQGFFRIVVCIGVAAIRLFHIKCVRSMVKNADNCDTQCKKYYHHKHTIPNGDDLQFESRSCNHIIFIIFHILNLEINCVFSS